MNKFVYVGLTVRLSSSFRIGNGTRQGGILSPTLFSRYVHDLLGQLANSYVGFNVGGLFVNVLAYADGIVLFIRTNILTRRFAKCSVDVKIILFRAYCMCLYDASLWSRYKAGSFNKLLSCCNKCLKCFSGSNAETA